MSINPHDLMTQRVLSSFIENLQMANQRLENELSEAKKEIVRLNEELEPKDSDQAAQSKPKTNQKPD